MSSLRSKNGPMDWERQPYVRTNLSSMFDEQRPATPTSVNVLSPQRKSDSDRSDIHQGKSTSLNNETRPVALVGGSNDPDWADIQDCKDQELQSQKKKRKREGRALSSSASLVRPYVLLGYVQFVFNAVLVIIVLYVIYAIIQAIQTDINIKVAHHISVMEEEIKGCSSHYRSNRCYDKENLLPALKDLCKAWEACMNRDPVSIGRAKISAGTLAEILNEFVEHISYKTMIFMVLVAITILFLSNAVFSFARSRYYRNQDSDSPSQVMNIPTSSYYSSPHKMRIKYQ